MIAMHPCHTRTLRVQLYHLSLLRRYSLFTDRIYRVYSTNIPPRPGSHDHSAPRQYSRSSSGTVSSLLSPTKPSKTHHHRNILILPLRLLHLPSSPTALLISLEAPNHPYPPQFLLLPPFRPLPLPLLPPSPTLDLLPRSHLLQPGLEIVVLGRDF